jgi:acyl carrier protein
MASKSEIRARLMALLEDEHPGAFAEMNFAEIGMDSLDVIQFIADVEGEFGVDVPLGLDKSFRCPRDVERWLVDVCR